ncbi:hypothetical protein A8O37_25410 [Pseudomonas aeruginosa]|nr:hypothetical protein A8O37_25410 [Pseudomonas aeruginosa]
MIEVLITCGMKDLKPYVQIVLSQFLSVIKDPTVPVSGYFAIFDVLAGAVLVSGRKKCASK